MPDPKLLQAAAEIKKILVKNEIAANVCLVSPTHGEYLRYLTVPWASFRVECNGALEGLRFLCRRQDYPSDEAFRNALKNSISLLNTLVDMLTADVESFTTLLHRAAKVVEWEHVTMHENRNRPGI